MVIAPTAQDVRRVLAGRRVRLVFQPIVDLRRGAVAGYECLARFDGLPAAGPDVWFSAAGCAGLGEDLEIGVVQQALGYRRALPAHTFLSINVSAGFLVSPGFLTVLERHNDLSGVVFEVTEHVPLPATAGLRRALTVLASSGGLIAMDDTGAGYSGLSQLLALRPQLVKLDRELVRGLHRDEARSTLVELLGELAGRLGAWLVAEGIETGDELDACIRLGIPLGQGHLLGRPAGHFVDLPADLGAYIGAKAAAVSRRDTVAGLLEEAVAAPDADSARALLATGGDDYVVVVDACRRPVQLVTREATAAGTALRVAPSTPVTDAARRATDRPAPQRFLPLTVTNAHGRLLGIVRIERLVTRLAQQLETPKPLPLPQPLRARRVQERRVHPGGAAAGM